MSILEENKTKINDALMHFENDLQKIRVGRPRVEMFEDISLQAYGSQTNLASVASINIVDATLVTVQPWDKNIIEDVLKGIQKSDLPYTPQLDNEVIKIPIPSMTQEKRQEAVKSLKELAEEYRIQIRVIRKHLMSDLDQAKDAGDLPEDVFHRKEKELQEQIDKANEKIAKLTEEKEKSLLSV